MRTIGITLISVLMVILVAVSLNISNESINQLTGEQNKAVVAAYVDDDILYMQLLGEEYQYTEPIKAVSHWFSYYLDGVFDYLTSIWTIFDAVFL